MKDKIKVIHLITKLQLGGAQINTLHTFQNLKKDIFKTWLLSGRDGILNKEVEDHPNFKVIKNLIRPLNPIRDFLCFIELIRALKDLKPDILHTHSSKAGIIGRIAARWCRIPTILHTVHGYSFFPSQFFLKRYFYIAVEWIVSKITTGYIFVSKSDYATARKLRFKLKTYRIIPSGFPFKDFLKVHHAEESINHQYTLNQNQPVIGTIAPLKSQKGLFHLIKIAHLVIQKRRDAIFFIAGDGDLRPAIIRELKRLDIEHNFRLPGFIFNIPKLLERIDIGLSCAIFEGLPQSLIQFRLKKIPVVVSDIPGHQEVVVEGKNGFLIPLDDHFKFAERLIQLIDDPPLLMKMGQFADEDFTAWDGDNMVQLQEKYYLTFKNKIQEKKR